MAGPVGALETALFNKLNVSAVTTLATGGVHNNIAPQDTAMPYVVFQWQSGGDENDHPKRSRDLVYTVKALAVDVPDTAEAIDAACDVLLHAGDLAVTGWNDFWCRREGDVAYAEVEDDGRLIYHRGGMYRIRLEAS